MANKATEIMAENIKLYLNKNGKTPANLIADLGIKRSTVYNWLNGVSYPRIDKIELLADYFGINKADLVEDKTKLKNNNTTNQEPIDLQRYAVDDSERDEAINAGGVPISDDDWEVIKAILSKYPRKDQQ
ncbi:XRE family transcriptional regulator [Weissella paramesenteroides]|uniref:helix-turn-helix domain-containing protein n=1 Tax=Weissella paramesenteroides TaxID=1249 RepID=UPI001129649F|nr:helix-turn-helix transcriptional regulator [Weissella paramesenteroides]TPF02188.1 XRE family transcriptional regulator [Weissella paramesenteroides]